MSSLLYLYFPFYRVDQDFDQSRVPSLLEKLMPLGRPKKITPDREATMTSREDCSTITSISPTPTPPPPSSTAETSAGGRNRAVVDSDSDNNKSDTSIESEGEEETSSRSRRKKLPPRKKRKIKK